LVRRERVEWLLGYLTASVNMLATKDMGAAAKVKLCYKTIVRVDAIRKALDSLVVTLIGISKRCAAYRAGINEVERVRIL